MAKLISRCERRDEVTHDRVFDWEGERDFGFAFPCGEDGTVLPLNPVASENYLACLTGAVDGRRVVDRGVRRSVRRVTVPAVVECDACCRHLELWADPATCECGAEYNLAGQRLAPREQWGEETGETASDILTNPDREEG